MPQEKFYLFPQNDNYQALTYIGKFAFAHSTITSFNKEETVNNEVQLVNEINIPQNVTINYICDDFLLHDFEVRYDVITGNPPFMKMNSNNKLLGKYRQNCINDESNNT